MLTGQHLALEVEEFGLERLSGCASRLSGRRRPAPARADDHRRHASAVESGARLACGARRHFERAGGGSCGLRHRGSGRACRSGLEELTIHAFRGRKRNTAPQSTRRPICSSRRRDTAAANLRSEAVRGQVHVTGNTGIDALIAPRRDCPPRRWSRRCSRASSSPVIGAKAGAKVFGRSPPPLPKLLAMELRLIDFVLHPNPHVAATMRQLLDSIRGISLIAPCTQSGDGPADARRGPGAQRLGRNPGRSALPSARRCSCCAKRPNGRKCIASGNARLVGTSTERIVAEVRRLLGDPSTPGAMRRPAFPYGDGDAAPRIAAIIERWLGSRRRSLGRQILAGSRGTGW